jgi:integrase
MRKDELDAGQGEKHCASALRRLESSTDVREPDRVDFRRFINHIQAEGVGKHRVIKYINHLTVLSRIASKPLRGNTREDVEELVGRINSADYMDHTKHDYKVVIKKYYQWLRGCEDGEYPPEVKWIKTSFRKGRLVPEALLTTEELMRLVDAAESPRDKALLLTDYESGCRKGEILDMRIRNVTFDQYGATLMVDGKTGPRRVRIIAAVPALSQWLNIHPLRDDVNAPLWVNMGTVGRYEPMMYYSARAMLGRLVDRTGIGKRVYSHLLRHTRATELSNILTDAQMKEHLGWVQGSDMPSVYVHLSGKNIDGPLLRASGIVMKENEAPKMNLTSETCPRCKQRILSAGQFCPSCGMVLDLKAARALACPEIHQG